MDKGAQTGVRLFCRIGQKGQCGRKKMQYRTLGRTGLKVSAITMGTFTFGGEGPFAMVGKQGVAEARELVALCADNGVNLFDTANMYSTGTSEEILGEVLDGRADKDDLLVTSKARMRIGDGPNDEGASRFHLIRECERSLKRLRRDHIDIYYIHEWDGTTPVEETMAALDTLVQQGKIRYPGCSNYSAWHVMKSLAAADRAGGARFATQQIHYTLEAREAEYELLPLSVDQGLGVLVWSPLAAGLLTGKHRRGADAPEGSRQAAGWNEPPIRRGTAVADRRRACRHRRGARRVRRAGGARMAAQPAGHLVARRRRAQCRPVHRKFRRGRSGPHRRRTADAQRCQPAAADLSLLAPAQFRARPVHRSRPGAACRLSRPALWRARPAGLTGPSAGGFNPACRPVP
jgi:aryl-alcohol dehydrogenase-like predicted oxidoreductase